MIEEVIKVVTLDGPGEPEKLSDEELDKVYSRMSMQEHYLRQKLILTKKAVGWLNSERLGR